MPFGLSARRNGVFAEASDIVFPLAQAASFSNVTQHKEYFPASSDILAAEGYDGFPVKLAQGLVAIGILADPMIDQTI